MNQQNKTLKVHIDPGHAGKYNQSPVIKTYYESEMNWKLSNLLKEELEKQGAIVTLSKNSLAQDPSLVNRGLGAKGCDLFLSIHSNATSSSSVDFPLVIRGFDKDEAIPFAQNLTNLVHETMQTKQAGKIWTKQSSKTGNEYYGVLRGARLAGLTYYYIIEHSFHTNKKSTEWLLNESNLKLLAKKEADLIMKTFASNLKEEDIKEENMQDMQDMQNVQNVQSTKYTTQAYIWNKLLNAIKNPYGVAGLMGNIEAESNFKANNLQQTYNKKFNLTDKEYTKAIDTNSLNFIDSAGYGLCQWTYKTRKQSLLDFARKQNKSIGDLDMQLDFILKELKGYKAVYNTLINTKSVQEASDIVLTGYEKPADQSDKAKKKRGSYSLNWFNIFHENKVETGEQSSTSSNVQNVQYIKTNFKVKIKVDGLNIRKGPGTSYKAVGCITDKGTYTIVETNQEGTWGHLKSDLGWICIKPAYVIKK